MATETDNIGRLWEALLEVFKQVGAKNAGRSTLPFKTIKEELTKKAAFASLTKKALNSFLYTQAKTGALVREEPTSPPTWTLVVKEKGLDEGDTEVCAGVLGKMD